MENAPSAPAAAPAPEVAPVASEAQPTTNPEPQAAPAPATPVANIPADQIEAFNRFADANGGFEKVFARMKSAVSNPAPQPQEQPAPQPQQSQQLQQPQQPQQPQQSQQSGSQPGFISQEEFAAQQYFSYLSQQPEYAQIADEVRSGAVLKEMAAFGISPMQNGQFNDGQVRQFLNLYAKTKPAQQTSNPLTTTPTVEYVNVGESINSIEDAYKVLNQNRGLGDVAPHPQTEAAKAFIKQHFSQK